MPGIPFAHMREADRPAATNRRQRSLVDLAIELDAILQSIDFDEVTLEDRVTFLNSAVDWEIRRALQVGRFGQAMRLETSRAWFIERVVAGEPCLEWKQGSRRPR